jgi:hypothetical protein
MFGTTQRRSVTHDRGAGPKELLAMLKTAERYLELQREGKITWDDPGTQSALGEQPISLQRT